MTVGRYNREGISITRGAQQVDANAARQVLSTTRWWVGRSPVHQAGAWQVFAVDFMPEGSAYGDTENTIIAVERDTWTTISHHLPAVAAFMKHFSGGTAGKGMGYLPMSEGVYAVASAKAGGQVREEVDPTGVQMASVAQMAERLVVQAAGVVQHADSQQTAIFLGNHAKIDEELQMIEAEVARVRQLVDLAKETVLGSMV